MQTAYAIFGTALGHAAVVWRDSGVVGVHLPEPDAERTRSGVLRRFAGAEPAEPSEAVSAVIAAVQALLRGEAVDLTGVELDLAACPPFNRRVYDIARAIAPGDTLTYGEVAERLGDPLLARAVGQALGQNPCPIVVPCHRVLAAGGRTGGFSARGGVKTKLKLLEIEGALAPESLPLFSR
ncbi:methylated-DNA--[protein]-cysteine S-methyltransferase [Phenylobacterium sp.]|jgi:methylated-DNA-[protein]-cysteine S-methyltransferase|uniref:methylated-DNA--[protein]-cysteine S-methyltransferase n=1 Tax=Phenylobacterium sp. TaxID=1871053 RepID=UPI002E3578C0|nr:methylated-DNA--[protein]-cysteine S-methyltransferase [Phenylobacterium sp.]HEX2559534.1 methylated-DNA--[protein]-cysteine S-methyltransferase [Phenylobacterium sp.]